MRALAASCLSALTLLRIASAAEPTPGAIPVSAPGAAPEVTDSKRDHVRTEGALTASAPATTPRIIESRHDRIWSGVILATNVPSPKPAPSEIREFAARLKDTFGYNQFEVIGSATELINEETESWLVPSPVISFMVKTRRAHAEEARGGYLLDLHLYQQKRRVVEVEAKLAPASPLFIRGPQYGKGQLVIALEVQRAAPLEHAK